jgi:hypothetical protein
MKPGDLILALFGFCTLRSVLGMYEVIVIFKPDHEQLRRMKNGETDLKIRGELMQPLSQEKLTELQKVAGLPLYDLHSSGLGGRVLTSKRDLSRVEMHEVIRKLETLPWVKYANPNFHARVPEAHISKDDNRE